MKKKYLIGPTLFLNLIFVLFVLYKIKGYDALSAPKMKSIEIFDENDNLLDIDGNWVLLKANNKIRVNFDGNATHVRIFTAPTGTETLLEQECIGEAHDVKWGEPSRT